MIKIIYKQPLSMTAIMNLKTKKFVEAKYLHYTTIQRQTILNLQANLAIFIISWNPTQTITNAYDSASDKYAYPSQIPAA